MNRKYITPQYKVAELDMEELLATSECSITSDDNNEMVNSLVIDTEGNNKVGVMDEVW